MFNSTFSLTSVLDSVGGQRYAPAALPPGKIRYPLYRRKISLPAGFNSWTVQLVGKFEVYAWEIVRIFITWLYLKL